MNKATQRRLGIREQLLAYCGRDTEGMVEIVEGLRRVVAER